MILPHFISLVLLPLHVRQCHGQIYGLAQDSSLALSHRNHCLPTPTLNTVSLSLTKAHVTTYCVNFTSLWSTIFGLPSEMTLAKFIVKFARYWSYKMCVWIFVRRSREVIYQPMSTVINHHIGSLFGNWSLLIPFFFISFCIVLCACPLSSPVSINSVCHSPGLCCMQSPCTWCLHQRQ